MKLLFGGGGGGQLSDSVPGPAGVLAQRFPKFFHVMAPPKHHCHLAADPFDNQGHFSV